MKNIHKLSTTFLFVLFCTFNSYAQNFEGVDAKVSKYPKSFASTDKFAAQVVSDFTREDEKARAIFTWIATNVKYDYAAYGVNERPVAYSYRTEEEKLEKQKKFKDDLATKTLKSKKAVCQGYSTLYQNVAQKSGLEAEIVTGTSKSHPAHIGKAPGASDHAWNVVKIDSKWKFVDSTWGAGVVTGEKPVFTFKFNDGYFFPDPDIFFLNHFPDDKKWLLTQKSEKQFEQLPLYYGNYLSGGYDFVSPVSGTFALSDVNVIPFKIKNLKSTDKIAYSFSKTNKFNEAKPVMNGDISEFEVLLEKNTTGLLTIFINQKSVAAYRILKS